MSYLKLIQVLLAATIVIAIISSVACGKDDDDLESLILGPSGGIILKTGKKGGKKGSTIVIARKKRSPQYQDRDVAQSQTSRGQSSIPRGSSNPDSDLSLQLPPMDLLHPDI